MDDDEHYSLWAEILTDAMDDALKAHRGLQMMDQRYHCLCGWVSEQDRASILGRADIRQHLVGATWTAIHEAAKVAEEAMEGLGE